jgi:hypothetical protein
VAAGARLEIVSAEPAEAFPSPHVLSGKPAAVEASSGRLGTSVRVEALFEIATPPENTF